MRPLELTLAHFGPYRDEVTLRFDALDRLFLICGPTGAGKTTLFDALTFALYERTPGTRSTLTDQLVSHHAPAGAVPRVSLRFALGDQEWRVTRHLRHRVPRQRGEGWKEQDAQVSLEKMKDGAWESIPGKRSELNERLLDLVGLSAEEFSKIVVLPQGDFQRFLEASSGERERMLQKLFPVEAYERLVERLKVRAKGAEDAKRAWEDRWAELQQKLGTGADRPALEAAAAEAAQGLQAAAQAEAEASDALLRLTALWDEWRILESKRQVQRDQDARAEVLEGDRIRMIQGRKARPLAGDLDRQASILEEGKALRATQELSKAELVPVEAELHQSHLDAEATGQREARLTQILQEKGTLEHQLTLWQQTQEVTAAETQAQGTEALALARLAAAEEALRNATQSVPPAPEGPGLEASLALLDGARQGAQAALADAELARQRRDLEDQQIEAAQAEAEARDLAEAAQREAALWTQIKDALAAADLAQTLQPDQPCPVCGSVHHPHPAPWPEASAETPVRHQEALAAQNAARERLAVAQNRRKDLADRLSALPFPRGLDPEAAERERAEAQTRVDTLGNWARADAAARALCAEAAAEADRARAAAREATAARESWTARRKAFAETVPQDPSSRLQALGTEEAALRRRLDTDRQRIEALQQTRQTLATRIEELEKQLVAQRDEYRKLQASLEDAAAQDGWTLDEARVARLDEVVLRGLEEKLERFDAERQRLAGELAALEAKFPEGEPRPLAPAAQALEERRADRLQKAEAAKEREFALRDLDRLDEEVRRVLGQKEAVDAAFQRLVPVAQALDGRNTKNLKLTTWVLIQALEQVTASATQRLSSMSAGRYALKVQTQGSDARRDWGLDLSVIDSYTGQERAVGTLSGGEKFMTSIALALGLADVIQERAGGLKLEAVFIDEGFGTLDDQSLDRAMAILHDLGQHRSVGIISHVPELRQRIGSRVEVVKGKNGSTLKVG